MFTMIFSQVVLTWGPLYSPFFSLWLRACHKTVPRQNRKNFPEIPTIQNRFVLYFYILVSILVLSNLKTKENLKMKDPENKKKLNKSEEATVAGGDWMQPIHDFGKNLNPPHDPSQPTIPGDDNGNWDIYE